MAKTIWKFPIQVNDEQTIDMPQGAILPYIDMQHGQPCIWSTVDPLAVIQQRKIRVFGTGHPLPEELGDYIGSFQMMGGNLVWHVFEAD